MEQESNWWKLATSICNSNSNKLYLVIFKLSNLAVIWDRLKKSRDRLRNMFWTDLKCHPNCTHGLKLLSLLVLEDDGHVQQLVERDGRDEFEICSNLKREGRKLRSVHRMSARALALEHVGIAGQELVQLILKLSCRQTHLLILEMEMETNNYLVDHFLRVVWVVAVG